MTRLMLPPEAEDGFEDTMTGPRIPADAPKYLQYNAAQLVLVEQLIRSYLERSYQLHRLLQKNLGDSQLAVAIRNQFIAEKEARDNSGEIEIDLGSDDAGSVVSATNLLDSMSVSSLAMPSESGNLVREDLFVDYSAGKILGEEELQAIGNAQRNLTDQLQLDHNVAALPYLSIADEALKTIPALNMLKAVNHSYVLQIEGELDKLFVFNERSTDADVLSVHYGLLTKVYKALGYQSQHTTYTIYGEVIGQIQEQQASLEGAARFCRFYQLLNAFDNTLFNSLLQELFVPDQPYMPSAFAGYVDNMAAALSDLESYADILDETELSALRTNLVNELVALVELKAMQVLDAYKAEHRQPVASIPQLIEEKILSLNPGLAEKFKDALPNLYSKLAAYHEKEAYSAEGELFGSGIPAFKELNFQQRITLIDELIEEDEARLATNEAQFLTTELTTQYEKRNAAVSHIKAQSDADFFYDQTAAYRRGERDQPYDKMLTDAWGMYKRGRFSLLGSGLQAFIQDQNDTLTKSAFGLGVTRFCRQLSGWQNFDDAHKENIKKWILDAIQEQQLSSIRDQMLVTGIPDVGINTDTSKASEYVFKISDDGNSIQVGSDLHFHFVSEKFKDQPGAKDKKYSATIRYQRKLTVTAEQSVEHRHSVLTHQIPNVLFDTLPVKDILTGKTKVDLSEIGYSVREVDAKDWQAQDPAVAKVRAKAATLTLYNKVDNSVQALKGQLETYLAGKSENTFGNRLRERKRFGRRGHRQAGQAQDRHISEERRQRAELLLLLVEAYQEAKRDNELTDNDYHAFANLFKTFQAQHAQDHRANWWTVTNRFGDVLQHGLQSIDGINFKEAKFSDAVSERLAIKLEAPYSPVSKKDKAWINRFSPVVYSPSAVMKDTYLVKIAERLRHATESEAYLKTLKKAAKKTVINLLVKNNFDAIKSLKTKIADEFKKLENGQSAYLYDLESREKIADVKADVKVYTDFADAYVKYMGMLGDVTHKSLLPFVELHQLFKKIDTFKDHGAKKSVSLRKVILYNTLRHYADCSGRVLTDRALRQINQQEEAVSGLINMIETGKVEDNLSFGGLNDSLGAMLTDFVEDFQRGIMPFSGVEKASEAFRLLHDFMLKGKKQYVDNTLTQGKGNLATRIATLFDAENIPILLFNKLIVFLENDGQVQPFEKSFDLAYMLAHIAGAVNVGQLFANLTREVMQFKRSSEYAAFRQKLIAKGVITVDVQSANAADEVTTSGSVEVDATSVSSVSSAGSETSLKELPHDPHGRRPTVSASEKDAVAQNAVTTTNVFTEAGHRTSSRVTTVADDAITAVPEDFNNTHEYDHRAGGFVPTTYSGL